MGNFFELQVWQKSKALAVKIYQTTNEESLFQKDFRLRDQLRKSAVSIPSNIAEGDELDSNAQSTRHFYIAKGSCAEIITQLIISKEIGFIDEKLADEFISQYQHVSHMLHKLIHHRRKKN